LKNSNNQFKWTDGSEMSFTNWAKGNPSNKTDHNCVRMISDSSPIGEWADEFCDNKHVIVCQKAPTVTIAFLQKKIVELSKKFSDNQQLLSDTRKQLSETQKQLDEAGQLSQTSEQSNRTNNTLSTYLNHLLSDKWINFKLFTDSDGKHKALFFHINKTNAFNGHASWDSAKKSCESLNASLVEIQTVEKQFILESFLGQFGGESNKLVVIWLNGHRESSGKWKWITSGKEFTYTNWGSGAPTAVGGNDYIYMHFDNVDNFGKWYNYVATGPFHVVCEIEVNFEYILNWK